MIWRYFSKRVYIDIWKNNINSFQTNIENSYQILPYYQDKNGFCRTTNTPSKNETYAAVGKSIKFTLILLFGFRGGRQFSFLINLNFGSVSDSDFPSDLFSTSFTFIKIITRLFKNRFDDLYSDISLAD